ILHETAKLDSQIKELDEKIKRINPEPVGKTREELLEESDALQKKINKLSGEKLQLNEKIESCSRQKEDLEKELKAKAEISKDLIIKESEQNSLTLSLAEKPSLAKTVEELDLLLKNISLEMNELNVKKKAAEDIILRVKGMQVCPTCLQKLSAEHKKVIADQKNSEISQLERVIREKKKVLSQKENELKSLKSRLEKLDEAEQRLNILKVEIINLKKISSEVVEKQKILASIIKKEEELIKKRGELSKIDINELNQKLAANKKLLQKIIDFDLQVKEKKGLVELLNDKIKRKEKLVEAQAELFSKIKELKLESARIEQELSLFESAEEEQKALRQSFEKLKNELQALEMSKLGLEKDYSMLSEQITSLDKEIRSMEETLQKIKNLSKLQHWLENYFVKLVSIMERAVMTSIYQEFNHLFVEWFSLLIADEGLSCRLDDSFSPLIEQNGYESSFENLSGGEKTSLALAYRLALNSVVNHLIQNIKTKDLLILDEPTDGFSSEQLDRVRDVFNQIKTRQLIIVSHEPKLESFVNNVIKIQKEEHVSNVF
ncbi:hypothetical protein D6745_00240, partial [Candidatus Woesearchaeota archaeon]